MAREMKDSGIEWIGKIPNNWEIRKVKHYYNLKTGFTPDTKREDYYDDEAGYEWVNISDIVDGKTITETKKKISQKYIDEFNPKQIPSNSLLYSFKLSVGQTAFVGKPMYTNEAIASFLPNADINLHFLRYSSVFIAENAEINIYNARILNRDRINNALIVFPPLDEQNRIASFLDTECARIDAVIEKTRESNEEYKKLKQSVITQAVTKGIRPNRKMKDSGIEWIGEIPEEWNIITAHRIIISTQNGITRRDLEQSSGQIVLKLKNITAEGIIDYSYINRIQLSKEEHEKYTLNEGDFLFVRVNGSKSLVGKCAVFADHDEAVAYNDHIIRVRLNQLMEKRYFQWFLLSNIGRTEIDLRTSTAAGQFTISGEGLRDINIILPPIDEQKAVMEYLEIRINKLDRLINQKEQLLLELESYKKSFIFEYVTGKKEVM